MTISLLNGTPLPAAAVPAALPAVRPESASQAEVPSSGSADMLFIDALSMLQAGADGTDFFAAPLAEEIAAGDEQHDDGDAEDPLLGLSLLVPPVMILVPQDNGAPAGGMVPSSVPLDAASLAAAALPGAQKPAAHAAGVTPTAPVEMNTAPAMDASIPPFFRNAAGFGASAALAYLQPAAAARVAGAPGTAMAAAPAAFAFNAAGADAVIARAGEAAPARSQPQLQAADLPIGLDLTTVAPADTAARASLLASIQHAAVRGDETFQSEAVKPAGGGAAHSRQALMEALGERIQVQAGRRIEHAVIRLDPPMMGSIEVVIRHEAGNLQVQLSATHNEVLRQLQNMGESLRQDLIHRQYNDVSVLVSNGMRDGDGRQRQRHAAPEPEEPGLALVDAGGESVAFSLQRDRI